MVCKRDWRETHRERDREREEEESFMQKTEPKHQTYMYIYSVFVIDAKFNHYFTINLITCALLPMLRPLHHYAYDFRSFVVWKPIRGIYRHCFCHHVIHSRTCHIIHIIIIHSSYRFFFHNDPTRLLMLLLLLFLLSPTIVTDSSAHNINEIEDRMHCA